MAFAFSFIFYPPEGSVFVTSDLLVISTSYETLLGLPCCVMWFSQMVRMAGYSAVGILFPHLTTNEMLDLPTYLLVIAYQG
ncbi:MAG: hypothetical protein F6K14_13775 [Symploca sp. SIO2C1]|nr:hypothetical protein [Symploca sp. SIO2C1]